jgi:flavodoxin
MNIMKADIVFFSRTGNTRKVVDEIFQTLVKSLDVNLSEIKAKTDYPYFIWLLLSFLPNFGVKIVCNDVTVTSDLVFICFPKWTINCPPVTAFLRQGNLTEKMLYLVITYGGFDEKRYAEAYQKKIKKLCKEVKGVLLVKRSEIKKGNLSEIRNWIERML